MEFKKLMEATHAVRAFTSKQVPEEDLRAIVQAASAAPSWMNAQERKVYIATGERADAIRKEYEELGAKETEPRGAYPMGHHSDWSEAAQVNMAHFQEVVGQVMGGDPEGMARAENGLFDAPAIVFLCLPQKPAPWGILDLGAFEEAIVLSAADRGISSIVAYAFTKYPDVVRKYLPIPDSEDIMIGIGLGYPDQSAPINSIHAGRVPLDQILTIN